MSWFSWRLSAGSLSDIVKYAGVRNMLRRIRQVLSSSSLPCNFAHQPINQSTNQPTTTVDTQTVYKKVQTELPRLQHNYLPAKTFIILIRATQLLRDLFQRLSPGCEECRRRWGSIQAWGDQGCQASDLND